MSPNQREKKKNVNETDPQVIQKLKQAEKYFKIILMEIQAKKRQTKQMKQLNTQPEYCDLF